MPDHVVHSLPAGVGDAQARQLWAEVQALRAENERLLVVLKEIAEMQAEGPDFSGWDLADGMAETARAALKGVDHAK